MCSIPLAHWISNRMINFYRVKLNQSIGTCFKMNKYAENLNESIGTCFKMNKYAENLNDPS